MIEDGWEARRGTWQVGDRVLLHQHNGYEVMTICRLGTSADSIRVDRLFEGRERRYDGQSEAEFGLCHALRCDDAACWCNAGKPGAPEPWTHSANECQLVPYVPPAVTEYGMPVVDDALF